MDIHQQIAFKRNELKALSEQIRFLTKEIPSANNSVKERMTYETLKKQLGPMKTRESALIDEVMAYNRKYVPSPLEDPRFNRPKPMD